MSQPHQEPALPRAAEELLEDWPAPSRDDAAWEAQAEAIEARVRETAIGSTEPDLLEAPLPAEPGEPTSPRARSADGTYAASPPKEASLSDLARAVVAPRKASPSQPEEDVLAVLRLSRERLPSRPHVERPVEEPPAPEPAAPVEAAEPPSKPRSVFPPAVRKARWAGVAVAAVGLAAALTIWVRGERRDAHDDDARPPAIAPKDDQGQDKPAEEAAPPARDSIDVTELPTEQPAEPAGQDKPSARPTPPATKSAQRSTPSSPAPRVEPQPAPQQPKAEEPPLTPAVGGGTDLDEKPSFGAVQAALSGPSRAARACVAGQSGPSQAEVVFASSGKVSAVTISGPAAGTPAEACIRSALSAARVKPFTSASYSVKIPIRPQ